MPKHHHLREVLPRLPPEDTVGEEDEEQHTHINRRVETTAPKGTRARRTRVSGTRALLHRLRNAGRSRRQRRLRWSRTRPRELAEHLPGLRCPQSQARSGRRTWL